MSPVDLLAVICSSPYHKALANHVLLQIIALPDTSDENPAAELIRQVESERFDEDFFYRASEQLRDRSEDLGQALAKRLKIYRLESGSVTPHEGYFKTIGLAYAHVVTSQVEGAQSRIKPAILEIFLSYIEEEGSSDASRSCPKELVQLLVRLATHLGFNSLYDPGCATANLMVGVAESLDFYNVRHLYAFGQSQNETDIFHARLRTFYKDYDINFETADAIQAPPSNYFSLKKFDLVVSDLSCGLDTWPQEIGEADPFERFKFGVPSRSKGEFAFLQQMIASMHSTSGSAIVIVNQAVLLRSGKDAEIRRALIESNLLDSVIFLPQKLYRGDASSLAILVFRASRNDAGVFAINASTDYEPSKSVNKLSASGIQKITDHFIRRAAIDGEALLISPEELRVNDYSVSLNRYFPSRREEFHLDLPILIQTREAIESELIETSKAIEELIDSLATRG